MAASNDKTRMTSNLFVLLSLISNKATREPLANYLLAVHMIRPRLARVSGAGE